MNPTALKIAVLTATAAALTVIGCASDLPEETANVSTEQGVDPARYAGAVVGTSGTIVTVQPGSNNWPQPVPQCPDACTRKGDYCECPHGFGVKSGVVCPYGQYFSCFAAYCACYNY